MPDTANAPAIHAVLFDFGLVLSGPPDPIAWQRMKDLFSATEAELHTAYWAYRHPYDRGTLNASTYWQQVAQRLHRSLTPEQLDSLINADLDLWTQPNQPMVDWAQLLQAQGMRTGILSNIGDAMEHGILARWGWLTNFAHHTFSHRLRIAKPEAGIYSHAAAGLGVPPAHILFIDDRQENIEAAHGAGMQAIQYTSHDAFLEAMRERGYAALLGSATKV